MAGRRIKLTGEETPEPGVNGHILAESMSTTTGDLAFSRYPVSSDDMVVIETVTTN